MSYYTDIDEDATIYIYFNMELKNFYRKPTSQLQTNNPRICLGIRPKGSNAFYDIGYFSMIDWESEPLKWKSKDGFYNDVNSYCGYGFDYNSPNYLPEEDNNWEILKSTYDSDSNDFTFSFRRNIMGTSKKDYTF